MRNRTSGEDSGSRAERVVVSFTVPYCCDGEVCPVDFFLDVLCCLVHAENWIQLEVQVYECVRFFEVCLGDGSGELESRGDKERGWCA